MILVYPLLVLAAGLLVWRADRRGRADWWGFTAWTVAGALFTFSLLTGLSIGLFLLPLVALAMYLAIRSAPDLRATLGFLSGIGIVFLIVASIHDAAIGWLLPGVVLATASIASFAALRANDRRTSRFDRRAGELRRRRGQS